MVKLNRLLKQLRVISFQLLIRDEYFKWKQGVYLSANRFPKTWENGI